MLKEKILDALVYAGMSLLILAIAVGVAEDFSPLFFQPLVATVVGFTGRLYPGLSPQSGVMQTLLFVGGMVLLIPPLMRKSWVFTVLQIIIALSALLPMWMLAPPVEICTRLAITYAGLAMLIWVHELPVSSLWKTLSPLYWWQSFRGSNGPNPLAAIGTEFIGWGYVFMGTNVLLAWCLILAGSIFLTRFAWLGMKNQIPMAQAWFILNATFVLAAGLKVGLLTGIAFGAVGN
jgi:hypothetical protein